MDQAQTTLKHRILLSPLDWGLGHATRCIPLIHELLRQDTDVFIACEGRIRILLEKEFPMLSFVDLRGYNVSYSKSKWSLPFTMLAQIPKIIAAIDEEHQMIDDIVKQQGIHGIISDNRFGLYHEEVPSVFITHQLLVKTNFGKAIDEQFQKLNYSFINKFNECWIPDYEGPVNLAGDLSHPDKMPGIRTTYTGPLSRLETNHTSEEKHLLILLSGPEPQRTILEELLVAQLDGYKNEIVFVRGLPGEVNNLNVPSHVRVYNHLPAKELEAMMQEARYIIGRTGYSTVMDIAALKKKSILIPTPGQTEQEYLALQLMKNNFALCINQQKFKLKTALELADHFLYQVNRYPSHNKLENVIRNFLSSLPRHRHGER